MVQQVLERLWGGRVVIVWDCVGAGFRDTGVLLWYTSFIICHGVTNRYGNRSTELIKSHALFVSDVGY